MKGDVQLFLAKARERCLVNRSGASELFLCI
jgi:hypothetical protein